MTVKTTSYKSCCTCCRWKIEWFAEGNNYKLQGVLTFTKHLGAMNVSQIKNWPRSISLRWSSSRCWSSFRRRWMLNLLWFLRFWIYTFCISSLLSLFFNQALIWITFLYIRKVSRRWLKVFCQFFWVFRA